MSLAAALAASVLTTDLTAPLVRSLSARPSVVSLAAALAASLERAALGTLAGRLCAAATSGKRSILRLIRPKLSHGEPTASKVHGRKGKATLKRNRLSILGTSDILRKVTGNFDVVCVEHDNLSFSLLSSPRLLYNSTKGSQCEPVAN